MILNHHHHHHHHHYHHVPGLLQTSAIMAFQSSLSSLLLISSLFGDSFLDSKLFRLPLFLCFAFLCFWYQKSFHSIFAFLVHQLCLYARKIKVFSTDLLYLAISITSSFDFFSVHDILIIHTSVVFFLPPTRIYFFLSQKCFYLHFWQGEWKKSVLLKTVNIFLFRMKIHLSIP